MAFASGFFKPGLWPYVLPVLLLICSNIFMTLAWTAISNTRRPR